MTIQQIYNLAIQMAIKVDPRGEKRIKYLLKREKDKYNNLKSPEKQEFDKNKLINPYGDTRYFAGNPNLEIKAILAGIDIGTGEVVLADNLRNKGKKIDLVLSHHPIGKGIADLESVMHLQADLLAQYGLPINIAESLLEKRINEVSRSISPVNHYQVVDAAKILDLPIMCIHTAADNLVHQFVEKTIRKNNPETLEDLIMTLKNISEYKQATRQGAGPRIFAGKPNRRCGKIAVTGMTGGTEGAKEIYEKLSLAGIGTVVGMHMKEENRIEAEKHHINVVIAGHMASDSLGLNLFLDQLEKKGIKVIPISGLIRVKREKDKLLKQPK